MPRPSNNNSRRRGRRRPNGHGNGNVDSSGPAVKVRGSAKQVYDKYLILARDAKSSGDIVLAESYFQHAEHYARILIENGKFDKNPSSNNSKKNVENGEDESNKENVNVVDGKELSEQKIPETNIKDTPVEESTIKVD
ncbi:MAG: DUF4167 domain-containing protein [Pseudomonadota bacterium]|nr:DUF4167 domain-containing protein [Pseudomonadota bacterium]MEC9458807.1 DUF4167 domain-containing protein [Pseudomonadota bacterium]